MEDGATASTTMDDTTFGFVGGIMNGEIGANDVFCAQFFRACGFIFAVMVVRKVKLRDEAEDQAARVSALRKSRLQNHRVERQNGEATTKRRARLRSRITTAKP